MTSPPKKTWFSKGIFQNVLQGGDCFCDSTQVLSLLATQSFSIFSLLTGDVSLSIASQGFSYVEFPKCQKISSIAYDTNHCPFSNPQTPGPDSPHPRVGADARWQGVCCQPFWVGQVLIWLETSYYHSRSLDVGVTTIASNRFKMTKQKLVEPGVIFPGEAADCGRPGLKVATFQVGFPIACTPRMPGKKTPKN